MTTEVLMKKQLKNLNKEIETLDLDSVIGWIEENIIEVRENGILTYSIGGPNIYINIYDELLEGYWGSDRVFKSCDTTVFKDYLELFVA
jgi:hypothetical protein